MIDQTLARRYAKAIYDLAEETDQVDVFEQALEKATSTLYSQEDVEHVWEGPQFPLLARKEVVDRLFKNELPLPIVNFLKLLIDKRRTPYLKGIKDAYKALADEKRGILDAYVETARPLTEAQKEALSQKLGERTGKTIRLHVKEDSTLLSGMRVSYDDYVIDGSARARLKALSEKLMNAYGGEGIHEHQT